MTNPRRRARAFAAAAVALSATVVGLAPTGALSGSTFEGNDGNLVVNGGTDWANAGITCAAPPAAQTSTCGIDLPTGQSDDSFGSGPGNKEDSPVPPITDGSIPNNKSDLLRFYVDSEKANGDDFLYLAWERVQEPTGTTNMDFEFNQSNQTTTNGVTKVRTPGDLLIRYDLSQGGTNPVLRYHRWVTSASDPEGPCFSAQSVPCWGEEHTLNGGNFEASINTVAVTDPIAPGAPRTLSARTFGEAAINLTDSGILQGGSCQTLGSAMLKSRSADSFTAAMKDFIAPIPVNITNCGSINIQKNDDLGGGMANVEFDVYADNTPVGGTRGVEDTITTLGCTTGATGACSISNVPFGNYWVVEVQAPAGYTAAADQAVVVGPSNTTVNLTFVNTRQPASVTVSKVDDSDSAAPLADATFTLYTNAAPTAGPRGAEDTITSFSCTTNAGGTCTIQNVLPAGSYWIVETVVPAGHTAAADRAITLALGQNLDLTSTPFVDPRQFRVITFVCVDSTDTLYAADIGYDGATPAAATPVVGGAITTTVQSAICGLTGQAVHAGGEGTHTSTVDID